MTITIEIRKSTTHHDSFDLQIDKGGWDRGLLEEEVHTSITHHVQSTMPLPIWDGKFSGGGTFERGE